MSKSNSDGPTVALGSRVNIFDSESEEFDTERQPGDPSKSSHGDDQEQEFPTVAEMLDRNRGNHEYVSGVNRDHWVAGTILRSLGNPTLHCPECWHEYDRKSELSDPEHHLPTAERLFERDEDGRLVYEAQEGGLQSFVQKHDHRRHRHCPECGAVSFGGVLADRSVEDFLDIVDAVFEWFDRTPPSLKEGIRESAIERKVEQDMSDEANMEQIVRQLRHGIRDFQ